MSVWVELATRAAPISPSKERCGVAASRPSRRFSLALDASTKRVTRRGSGGGPRLSLRRQRARPALTLARSRGGSTGSALPRASPRSDADGASPPRASDASPPPRNAEAKGSRTVSEADPAATTPAAAGVPGADPVAAAGVPGDDPVAVDVAPAPLPAPSPLTARSLLAFGVPALGALLADPLCSLVDTAAVGRAEYASSAGLAALGPNTAIFGGLNMVFSFLTTATTASVARLAGRPRETAAYVCAALRVAAGLGVLCAAALHAGALPLLAAFNVPAELAPLAAEYLKIRASCLPALLVATVCVATCLGKKDPKSPLVAAALATAVNVALDAALVLGPPKLGVHGAAAATAAAQFCAAWALVRRVVFTDDEVGAETRERIFAAFSFSLEGAGTPSGANRRSRLGGFEAYAPLLTAWPVALRSVVLMAAVAGVTASAARLGVVPVAAHQIMLSVLTVAQFFPEPVSQAAQAFLAKGAPGVRDGEDATPSTEGEVSKGDGASDEESDGDVERDFSAESVGDDGSRDFVDSSTRTLTRAAALCSLITAAFAAVPALMPEAFTADAAVAAAVRGADLQLVATCALPPWVCVTDGLLLARREYALCTAVLCVAASVTFAYLGAGPFGALNGPPLTLAETWAGFLLLQAARLAQNAGRLWWIRRARANKGFGRGNKGGAYVKL